MINFESVRTKRIVNNILGASFYKGINIVFNFLLVRYAIAFIGEEKYGVWLTIFSFFTWFSALEVGVSNSFRNQLTRYFADSKLEELKRLLAKGYKALAIVYLTLIGVLVFITFYFPITNLFVPEGVTYPDLKLLFGFSLVLYLLHYIFFFLNAILLAVHRTQTTYLLTAIQNGILLLGVILFTYYDVSNSLLLFCIWFSIIPFLTWSISGVVIFKTVLKKIKPSIKSILFEKATSFQKMDKSFFIIQLCTLVIFSTDNIIIVNQLSGAEVTNYHVAFKYFNITIVIFNLILVPYWASFAEAEYQQDKVWIKKSIKKLIGVWVAVFFLAVVMLFISKQVYQLWLGYVVEIPFYLSLVMGISVLLTSWNNIFAYFLNGIDKTARQMKILLFSAVINIPLSFLLLQYFNSMGVILATCISLVPLSIALPIQYKSVMKQMVSVE